MGYYSEYLDRKSVGAVVSAAALDTPLEEEIVPVATPPNEESVEDKIRKAFPECPEIAVAIAKSESGMENKIGDKPLAWNDGRNGMSCGVFQIRIFPSRPDCNEMLDPDKNIAFAKELYDKSGWYPWSNFKNGRYLQFM